MKPLELRMVRLAFLGTATEGELYDGPSRLCHTLEDTVRKPGEKVFGKTAIPFGRYRLALHNSPRFKRVLPWLQGVPGFSYILIHRGNAPKDTAGCILVGYGNRAMDDAWISQSAVCEEDLTRRIVAAIDSGREAWLTVCGPTLRNGQGGTAYPVERAAVRVLQRWLRMPDEHRTGYFGPITENAVRNVQITHGLFVDGICGPDTWSVLA